jgi:hypothetical protein
MMSTRTHVAYVDTQKDSRGKFSAKVVSWQDYHERGPFSYTYVCGPYSHAADAIRDAVEWAIDHGYSVQSAERVANGPEEV